MSSRKQHFSHPHILTPFKIEQGKTINCKACQQRITEHFHGCVACNYYLHDECLNAPRYLHHPSHASHHLTLLPFPTYPNRGFECDGCGLDGNSSFTYSCSCCNFDLHIRCALSPPTLILDKHPHHELKLIFDSAQRFKDTIFGCDICGLEVHLKNWVYYCGDCNFVIHLHCAFPNQWQEEADNEVCNSGSDQSATTQPSKPNGGGAPHLSLAMDEVMEIQIRLARLQNQLSKAQMTRT